MFDDVFALIDDWFAQNQELNFEELNLDHFNDSNDLVNSDSDSSVITDNSEFNEQQSLIDSEDYSSDLINEMSESLVNENGQNLALDIDNSLAFSEPETEMLSNFFAPENYYDHQENWDVSQFDGVGNPFEDAQYWQQQAGSSSCAVVAQMGVYESITGNNLSEEEVCQFAEANGWFDPNNGTSPQSVGNILNAFGVPTEASYNADLNDIAEALANGDKVIVAVDANEIWQPIRDSAGNPIEQEDGGHAVWVTGIDQLPDGSVKLILNDSGTPDGQMKVVDAVDFANAWSDFDNHLVIAKPESVIV